jgi:deoxyribodipyrimidine photo-lyase
MTAAAACALDVRLELVDGNGLLPLSAVEPECKTAYAFRRHLQRQLMEAC